MRNGPNSLNAAVDLAAAVASLSNVDLDPDDGDALLQKLGFSETSRARLSDRMVRPMV